MNLTSKTATKNLLKKYRVRSSKKLGQNFLIDGEAVKKIIKAAELNLKDSVLEIGPGLGVLTKELAKRVKKVIAVEKDREMIEILKETLEGFKNIRVFRGDILKIADSKLPISNYKVVANLPFYLTAPAIRKFLETVRVKPEEMILVIQKEVGQRIVAQPPKTNLLAVSVQFYARPEIKGYVSKKSFWPQPKVDSAIIKITPGKISRRTGLRKSFFEIVRAGFSQPRKQLINNLSKKLGIDKEKVKNWLFKNDVNPGRRAESLTLQDWIKLAKSFKPR